MEPTIVLIVAMLGLAAGGAAFVDAASLWVRRLAVPGLPRTDRGPDDMTVAGDWRPATAIDRRGTELA